MTGPEHYTAAEGCLATVRDLAQSEGLASADADYMVKGAIVHALLALAAATAGDSEAPFQDWEAVLT